MNGNPLAINNRTNSLGSYHACMDGSTSDNDVFGGHAPSGCAREWPSDSPYFTNMRKNELFEWVDGRKLSETSYANWRWCNNDPDGEVVSLFDFHPIVVNTI